MTKKETLRVISRSISENDHFLLETRTPSGQISLHTARYLPLKKGATIAGTIHGKLDYCRSIPKASRLMYVLHVTKRKKKRPKFIIAPAQTDTKEKVSRLKIRT